jgi:flagellar motor component MotA
VEETEKMEAMDADSTEKQEDKASHPMEKMVSELPEDGIMITTVGLVDLISNITV